MKNLITKTITLLAILAIPLYCFYPDNVVLQKIMLGSEFLHWAQIVIAPITIISFNKLAIKICLKKLKENPKDEEAKELMKFYTKIKHRPIWMKFITIIDLICLLMLVFYLNDFSFSIAVFICVFLDNIYELQKRDIVELISQKK